MSEGRLWFDDRVKIPLIDRLMPAIDNYHKRMGQYPNTVYLNPKTLAGGDGLIGVQVSAKPDVIKTVNLIETEGIAPNHFFLTVEEEA